LPLGSGGTSASLSANTGGIFYSTNSTGAILSGTATANKVLMSGSTAAPTWSVPTFPNSSATAGKVIVSDGTNWVASVPTFPNSSATAGKIGISDGTNWIASTPTYPNAATTGKVLIGDGTNIVLSTPSYPNTSAALGKILRSDGTNYIDSTSTFADGYGASEILYSNGVNVVQGLATGNSGVLITSGAGVPSISSTLPATVQGNITAVGTIGSGVWSGTAIAWSAVNKTGSSVADLATRTVASLSDGGNVALLNAANTFSVAGQTISAAAPSMAFTDTTGAAKSLTIAVDANVADLRESAGGAGSLLVLDLANNRIGLGVAAPLLGLDARLGPTGPEGGGAGPAGSLLVGSTATAASITFGVNGGFGGWIQSRNSGSASFYNLSLNPSGGSVGIGMDVPPTKLFAAGTIAAGSYTDGSNYEYGTLTQAAGLITLSAATAGSGTDNIDIVLTPIGTGDVKIGKALVALGGGAAPTLGTIGGAGPTAAAQNTWLQLKDSAGNPMWVPIWK
jgi:hypothetical protein